MSIQRIYPQHEMPLRRTRRSLAESIGFLVICGLGILTACDWGLEKDPEEIPLHEIIELRRVGSGSLPADGAATDMLYAQIPEDVDATMRTVTFATTAGSFVGAPASANKSITVRAEKEGSDRLFDCPAEILPASQLEDWLVACAVIRSDTAAGTATVTASISGFKDRLEIAFGEAASRKASSQNITRRLYHVGK